MSWDGYIEVRGNRYSVPDKLCGAEVVVHIGLDGVLKVFDRTGELVANHLLKLALISPTQRELFIGDALLSAHGRIDIHSERASDHLRNPDSPEELEPRFDEADSGRAIHRQEGFGNLRPMSQHGQRKQNPPQRKG